MRIEGVPGRLRLPVIGAPMFLVSGPELVTAQCKAGIIGAFPALNARGGHELDAWLTTIRGELAAHDAAFPDRPAAPFAVNQIVHPGNPRLEDDVEICLRHKVPIIITSLQAPGDLCARVHGYGGLVWHDVVNIRHAEKALADGADGLIAVCAGAGGHAGSLSPFALITELRRFSMDPSPCRARFQRAAMWRRRGPWAPIWPMSAPASSPPLNPVPQPTTARRLSRPAQRTSS